MKVLAWRFDHVGDCNRYGNCVDHPYFELPAREELVEYPATLPSGVTGLEYVPLDAVTDSGALAGESQQAFDELRRKAETLRASVGEALHSIQRDRVHEVVPILDAAVEDFDRAWNFTATAESK
jgi:hypothetical protein